MTKTLLYRLLGIGKIPEQLKAQLESEGIIQRDEGFPGSVTYTNFHRPRHYSSWRRDWYTASLVITQTRLVAQTNSTLAINVPFSDARFRSINISLEKADTLLVAFDVSLFHDDWSGKIEYRFRSPEAQAFLDALKNR